MPMNEQNQDCPVCRGNCGEDSQNVTVEGKTFRVCCDDCAQTVKENPSKYTPTIAQSSAI